MIRKLTVFTLGLLSPALLALASPVVGVVTNKTTGAPSAGDKVALVDIGAGMKDTVVATTGADGRYRLEAPGQGPYLVRADHQGGSYFIAAPQKGGSGDIGVYDSAARVEGVAIDADMMLFEAAGGKLHVQERFLIRNASQPPRAQFAKDSFVFTLPEGATLDGATASRPGGMSTNIRPAPLGDPGRYAINVPIQPSIGEKMTVFEIQYHMPYSGQLDVRLKPTMKTDNLVVYLAKGIRFAKAAGASFVPANEDPRVATYEAKNIAAGQTVSFAISGEGEVPREAHGEEGKSGAAPAPGGSANNSDAPPAKPVDPIGRQKIWIVAGLVLLMAAAAAFYLRQPASAAPERPTPALPGAPIADEAGRESLLLEILKEELFALESERIAGSIGEEEYVQAKAGLERLLRRAVQRGKAL